MSADIFLYYLLLSTDQGTQQALTTVSSERLQRLRHRRVSLACIGEEGVNVFKPLVSEAH